MDAGGMDAAHARMPADEDGGARTCSMWWKTTDGAREEEAEERVWREDWWLEEDASTGRSMLRQAALQ